MQGSKGSKVNGGVCVCVSGVSPVAVRLGDGDAWRDAEREGGRARDIGRDLGRAGAVPWAEPARYL